jgi:hypothetical protein
MMQFQLTDKMQLTGHAEVHCGVGCLSDWSQSQKTSKTSQSLCAPFPSQKKETFETS